MVEAAEAVVCGVAASAEASCGGIGVCCSTMSTAAATAPTAVMPPPRAPPPVVTLPASEATAAATSMASFCRGDDDALLLHDCDEHLLLSSMLYSSLTAKGAAGALLDEAGVASVRSFQIEAGKGAGVGAASASLNKVLVEVVGVVLVTKNGLHASDELIVVVVIKKGFAVVTVCEASTEAVEAAATAGAVARVAEDTLLDLVVDATNACQTGPRTFGTTAAAAATAIVVSLVSKVSFLLGEASVILRSSRNSRLFFVIACCKRR